jgi:hypothetical protein
LHSPIAGTAGVGDRCGLGADRMANGPRIREPRLQLVAHKIPEIRTVTKANVFRPSGTSQRIGKMVTAAIDRPGLRAANAKQLLCDGKDERHGPNHR